MSAQIDLELRGDAADMLRALRQLGDLARRARVDVSVRTIHSQNRRVHDRESVPTIEAGDAERALEHASMWSRQRRLEPDDEQELFRVIEEVVALTK
jgi:hypothetical protein